MDKINHYFDRTIELIGEKNFKNLANKKIVVIGLGGVGGFAVEALVRLGSSNITVCDYDDMSETNLNRQIISNISNIGKQKSTQFTERILNINPDCNVKEMNEKLTKNNIEKIINKKTDYVVEAIDDTSAKFEIYRYCLVNKIKLISSMGMANKVDATRIKITTLDKTIYDPLARKLRKLCKKENINAKKINIVYSDEPLYNNAIKSHHQPSIIIAPAVAGLLMAQFVLLDVIKKGE